MGELTCLWVHLRWVKTQRIGFKNRRIGEFMIRHFYRDDWDLRRPEPVEFEARNSAERRRARMAAATLCGMSDQGRPPYQQPPTQQPYPQQTSPYSQQAPAGAPTQGPYAYAPYAYPYAAPRRSGWFWAAIFAAIVAVVVITFAVMFGRMFAAMATAGGSSTTFGQPSIGVIDITGVIVDADKINKQLERFGNDDGIKAIVLHIDSPGGGAAASQEVYHEVLRVRNDLHKQVVASVESVGASGAYYIASGCDRIYANPASVVGSIGVIMEWTNYGDLLRWAKLKNVNLHKGELKDAGDPTRDMTPQEQAYFQGLIDNMYGQFVRDVAAGRHTSADKIQPLATGQVWTGEQAQPLGLIDAQGGFRAALLDTAKRVGLKGEPRIVRPPKEQRGLMGLLTGDETTDLFTNPTNLLNQAPGFYFLWK
jgi:protease-4